MRYAIKEAKKLKTLVSLWLGVIEWFEKPKKSLLQIFLTKLRYFLIGMLI